MRKKLLTTILFIIITTTYLIPHNAIAQDKLLNSATILCDYHPVHDDAPQARKSLVTNGDGIFNVVLLTEKVTESDQIYKMISQSKVEGSIKKRQLRNLTNGYLKIYFDLGIYLHDWKNNRDVFDRELKHKGLKGLDKPPDVIIISHCHCGNYLGGLEYMRKTHPEIPVLITPDMKEGLLCFDVELYAKNVIKRIYNGRTVKAGNAVVLSPGLNALTRHLSVITRPFPHSRPNYALKNGVVYNNVFSNNTEYENTLAIDTKDGVALIGACMHCSFLETVKKAMSHYKKNVSLYCGGYEDVPCALEEAKRQSPDLFYFLYHCAPVEEFIEIYGDHCIYPVRMGESIYLNR